MTAQFQLSLSVSAALATGPARSSGPAWPSRSGTFGTIMSRVRQFSVLFVKMDWETAGDKANECLRLNSTIDEVRTLWIDDTRKEFLEEQDVGVRMFFHCKESKNEEWRKNMVNDISKNNLDMQIGCAKKKGENSDAGEKQNRKHMKIWKDPKYDQFRDTMQVFRSIHSKEDEKSGINGDPASSYRESILDELGNVRRIFFYFLSSYTVMSMYCCSFLGQVLIF